MQIGRNENANANNPKICKKNYAKKCMKNATYKGKRGPRQKKHVQNGSKFFSGAFGAGYILSFQGTKHNNFCQEKARKCKKNKNATTQQKMLNGPKCKIINNNKKYVCLLSPPPCYLLFLGHWLFLGRVGGKTFFLYYLFFFPQQMFFFPQCFFPLKPARSKTQFFPTSAFGARLFYPQEKSTGWEKKTFFLYYYFFLNKKSIFLFPQQKKHVFFQTQPCCLQRAYYSIATDAFGWNCSTGGGRGSGTYATQ